MTWKVIVWGTGRVGRSALISILQRPELELVGVFVYSDSKLGLDAGDLCGLGRTGIKATNIPEEIYKMDADIVVMTNRANPTDISDMDRVVLRLLESGKNVVTTAAYRYLPYPGITNDRTTESVQAFVSACRKGNSTLYGTGENPGFFFERFVPTLTGLSQDVRCITLEEYSDCSHWVIPGDNPKNAMRWGVPIDDFRLSSYLEKWFDREFGESISCAAKVMGIAIDRFGQHIVPYPARTDFDILNGTIKEGAVAAIRYEKIAYRGTSIVLRYRAYWVLSKHVVDTDEDVRRTWRHDDCWRVRIEGRPDFTVTVDVGLGLDGSIEGFAYTDGQQPMFMITAAAAVNSIPFVCAAGPGIMTPAVQGHYSPVFGVPGFVPPVLVI